MCKGGKERGRKGGREEGGRARVKEHTINNY